MEDYRLEQSGQEVQNILNGAAMQTDLTAENERAELAEQTLQGNIDAEALARENADIELQGHIDDEETRAKAAEKQNADDIDAIEEKIPTQASSSNQLADKDYVEDLVSTSSATFRGTFNLVSDLHLTVDASYTNIAAALGNAIAGADNNDFAFVMIPTSVDTPNEIARIEKYKFNGSVWGFEYVLNNSGFTAAQWAAINSGITSALVTKLGALPSAADLAAALLAKQDKLNFDQAPTPSSTNPVTSGGVYTAIDDEKGARVNADAALQQAIEAILLLIPSAATALNQLADKAFVNSSIATATATFRGTFNLVSDLQLTVDATHADIAAALLNAISTADNNDYAFVQIPTSVDTPTEIRVTERYKFDGTAWSYEYDLNNSGFTAAQWAAINSGITASLLNNLADKPYVLAQIIAAIPSCKGQFTTLAELQLVSPTKAGDLGIVRTKDSDGYDVFTFYQYLNNTWNVFYMLSHHPQTKPATTGTTGDYPYNGMGRVVLPINIKEIGGVTANYLEQSMMPTETGGNIVYVIQHDFDLGGETIVIPANSVLKFEGGSLSNGTITPDGSAVCYIDAGPQHIFDQVIVEGRWGNTHVNALWFGAKANTKSVDNSDILNWWWDHCSINKIEFPSSDNATWYFNSPVVFGGHHSQRIIEGNNCRFVAYDLDADSSFITLGTQAGEYQQYFILSNIHIEYEVPESGIYPGFANNITGIEIGYAQLWNLSNVKVWNFFTGIYLHDTYYGTFSGMCSVRSCWKAIVLGNEEYGEVNTVNINNVKINSYLEFWDNYKGILFPRETGETDEDYLFRSGTKGVEMNCLCQNVKIWGCVIEAVKVAVYVGRELGGGSVSTHPILENNYFESDDYGFVVSKIKSGYRKWQMELTLSNSHFHGLGSKKVVVAEGNYRLYGNEQINLISHASSTTGVGKVYIDAASSVLYDESIEKGGWTMIRKEDSLNRRLESTQTSFNTSIPLFDRWNVIRNKSLLLDAPLNTIEDRKIGVYNVAARDKYKELYLSGDDILVTTMQNGGSYIEKCKIDTVGKTLLEIVELVKSNTAWEGSITDGEIFSMDQDEVIVQAQNNVAINKTYGYVEICTSAYFMNNWSASDNTVLNPNGRNIFYTYFYDIGCVMQSYSNRVLFGVDIYSKIVRGGLRDSQAIYNKFNCIGDTNPSVSEDKLVPVGNPFLNINEKKVYMWNGTSWVDFPGLTSPLRYKSVDTIANRAICADAVRQIFMDSGTGDMSIYTVGRWLNFAYVPRNAYPTMPATGDHFYHTGLKKELWYNGTKWVENDGADAGVARSGVTANRPVGSSIYVGFMYFDTSSGINKPIYASAISGDTVTWVDATGTSV